MEYPNGFKSGLPNCAIVSIAALTGAHYDDVWNWFKSRNNRPGQWRGRTYTRDYLDALKELGASNSHKFHTLINPMPLHYWVNIYSKKNPDLKFLVHARNHIMSVHNGIVLDQNKIAPVLEHPSKGRRIKEAWVVK